MDVTRATRFPVRQRLAAGLLAVCIILLLGLGAGESSSAEPAGKPNLVLILADDLGYGDVGCFGAQDIRTPRLDQLAAEGLRLTDFYVSQPVCSASRASLMTGCYANRIGMEGALNHTSEEGLHRQEVLLAEILHDQGYATAVFGKWHLGLPAPFNPLRNGFDEYFGIPYSNDNSKYHPVIRDMPPLPLYDGLEVVGQDPDQSQFTRWFTERSVKFIERHKDQPFFLYVPHVMPHVPIFASQDFKGRSQRGLYGDVVEELDWSVGRILDTLRQHGLEQNTWVIVASDNGPFLSYGEHAGSSGPLREGKLTVFEGGVRVPCLMRWPAAIPASSVCREPVSTIDLLPTICRLLQVPLPEHPLDGLDILPVLREPGRVPTPHEALFFYAGTELHAMRSGRWKLHFPHPYLTVDGEPGRGGKPANFGKLRPRSITQSGLAGIASRHGYRVEQTGLELYDLQEDVGETRNVAPRHPEVVQRLEQLAEAARAELGDSLRGRSGRGLRPVGEAARNADTAP